MGMWEEKHRPKQIFRANTHWVLRMKQNQHGLLIWLGVKLRNSEVSLLTLVNVIVLLQKTLQAVPQMAPEIAQVN